MIDRLTPQQEDELLEFRTEWRMATLSTAPANRPEAERAVKEMLGCGGPQVEWAESPLLAFQAGGDIPLHSYIFCRLYTDIYDCFRAAVSNDARSMLWRYLQDASKTAFRNAVLEAVREVTPATLRNDLYHAFSMEISAELVSYILFSEKYLGVKYPPRVSREVGLFASLVRSAGYLFRSSQGELRIVLCERPCALHFNAANALHCDHAPAVEYRDGFRVWVLDGHTADERLVMRPETQNLDDIKREWNAELKRIRIERYAGPNATPAEGWKRYLKESDAQCIDRIRNDVENTEEALFRTDGEKVLVCACPSTARLYALEVPRRCFTVAEAQAYLHSRSQMDATTPNVIGRS